jgi:hypothetical protein
VALVVEITSPGHAAVDRAVKPQLYTRASIPHYLRIELGEAGPSALVHRLDRDRYVQVARVDPGAPLALTDPIAVTLDLTALVAATRPPVPDSSSGRITSPLTESESLLVHGSVAGV